MGEIQSYRDLIVWQKPMDLATACHVASRGSPKEELFSLTNQIRRAGLRIAANIAEGHGRHSRKEFLYFLSVARGSLAELETHLLVAARLHYRTPETVDRLVSQGDEVIRLLAGLRRSIEARVAEPPRPSPLVPRP